MRKKGHWCEGVTDVYVALMLTVFPFYVEGDYTTLTAGKYRIFLILCGGYVMTAAIFTLLEKREGPPWRAAERCAAIYLLITLFSAAISPYAGVWLGNGRCEGAVTIAIYVLSFFFLARYGKVKGWQLHLLGGSVGLYAVVCLLQLAGANPLGLFPGTLDYADAGVAYNGAFLGTMGNAGLSGAWLSLALPMLLAAVVLGQGSRWLLLPLAAGVLTVVGMDVSAAALALFGGALLSAPVLVPERGRKAAAIFVAAVLLLALAALWCCPFPGTAGELHLLLRGTVDDRFGSGRVGIWRQLLAFVPERWLFGSGPDTVGLLGLAPFVRENGVGEWMERAVDTAHNEYLQILVCQGAFALAAYLGLLLSLGRRWLTSQSVAAKILGCGVLGYCIQAFFGISMCITAPLFWMALGLLAASLGTAGTEHSGNKRFQNASAVL